MTHLRDLRPELVAISGRSPKARDRSKDAFEWLGKDENGYLWTDDDLPLPIQLHCLRLDTGNGLKGNGKGGGRPVLLVHGASAGADTFLVPKHGGGSFVDHLIGENYEPWLLDWRASKDVTDVIVKLTDGEELDLGLPDDLARKITKQYEDQKDTVFEQLNFNLAAKNDITRALDAIRALRPGHKIDVVAHCMGAAIMAEALVRGDVQLRPGKKSAPTHPVSHVVLSTIGMFYQMNLHGRLKAEAHLLKRAQDDGNKSHRFLDPRIDPEKTGQDPDRPLPKNAWPEFIETLYGAWRVPYHQERLTLEDIPAKERPVFEMFNRLSFMYGEPYQEGNLAPEIHHRLQELAISPLKDGGKLEKIPAGSAIRVGETAMGEVAYDFDGTLNKKLWVFRTDNDFKQGQLLSADGRLIGKVEKVGRKDDMNGPLLPMLFGPMSLDLFRHGAENLRAGVATTLKDAVNDSGNGDHDREPEPILAGTDDAAVYERLERLDGLTLIGGGLNRLWHRDCIDRMADWLDRSAPLRETCRKTMLLNYGHQDLFWGRNAARDVFPKIVDGLGSPSPDAGPKDKEPEEDDPRRQQVPVS